MKRLLKKNDQLGQVIKQTIIKNSSDSILVSIVGPYWQKEDKKNKKKNTEEKARRLKAFLADKLNMQQDVTVSYGEFHLNKTDKHGLDIKEINSLGNSDLIILLPSSPGSFCLTEAITNKCSNVSGSNIFSDKIILFVDTAYEKSNGYISKVLLNDRATDKRIQSHFVDYSDYKTILSQVETKLQSIRRNLARQQA